MITHHSRKSINNIAPYGAIILSMVKVSPTHACHVTLVVMAARQPLEDDGAE